ncbi:hypothetical protein ABGF48_00790 [Helcococcus bovis]|uniref:hypothetical protein n=1 Tax=Helcococcus bovis TaxID=3153252 RepID=UPI0038B75BF1
MAERESEEQGLLKEGLLALLRFRVNRLANHIQDQRGITIDEKIDLDDLFTAYKSLGGNSRTELIYKEAIKLPIIDSNRPENK